MFNRNTCAVAANISLSLQARHTKLTPQSREMGVLIEQVMYPIVKSNISWGADNIDDLVKTMSLHDMSDEDGAGDQQQAIEAYTAQMAETLKTNLNLTRRVAIPLIEKIFDDVRGKLDHMRISNYDNMMYGIQEAYEYVLIDNPMFTDLVMRYSDSNFDDAPNSARILPMVDKDVIKNMLKTGSETFDKLVYETLMMNGHDSGGHFSEFVWNKHFLHPEIGVSQHTVDNIGNRGEEFAEWSLAFLIATSLLNSDLPDGVSVSLEDFKTIINRYRAYCGYQVQRLIKNYQAKRQTGMLVIDEYENNIGMKVLLVVPEVYKQAMEQGITSETITGHKLMGGTSWFLDTVLKNKVAADDAFKKAISEQAVALQINGRKILRETTFEAIRGFSNTVPVIDDVGTKAHIKPSVESIGLQMNTATKEIDDIFDAGSVLKYIQEVVTKGLFDGTMVSLIVERMDVFLTSNSYGSVTDVRHAGLMAAMSICVDSLVSQFNIDLSIDK